MDAYLRELLERRLSEFAPGNAGDRFKHSVLPTGNPFLSTDAPLYVRSGVEDLLADLITQSKEKVVLVTGCAGSGKTTLVDFVLRSHLKATQLRFFTNTTQARIDGRSIPQETGSQQLREAIEQQCLQSSQDRHAGRPLLFVDGLDETRPEVRPALLDSCCGFLRTHMRAKVVLTSRPYTLDSDFDPKTGFRGFGFSKIDLSASALGMEPVVELYTGIEPPAELVSVVQGINFRLIAELKKRPESVHQLSPRAFEELIAEILASYGWRIHITAATRDGGYDIFAVSKDISGASTSWVVECKRYSPESKVGVDIARSLYAVKGDLRVANAMIATTSHFTSGVVDFKNSRYDFHLRDYESLVAWLQEYRPNPTGRLYLSDDDTLLREKPRRS